MIIDSHCHLDYEHLYDQLDNIILRAKKSKVDFLLTICTTLKSFEKIKLIIEKYKNVYGTFGIHPHETSSHLDINSDFISKVKKENNKIIGIGETGLDFYYNHSDKKVQIKSFVHHIEAASRMNIPVIVHSRNAEAETLDILKSESKNSNLKVLIHCFTGSKEFANKLIDLNFFISVSGIITFKNSNELVDTISEVPIENLLVETDSPYLAPVPERGKKNEPSFIVHTVEKLSAIKKLSPEDVATQTTNNFNKLFNLL